MIALLVVQIMTTLALGFFGYVLISVNLNNSQSTAALYRPVGLYGNDLDSLSWDLDLLSGKVDSLSWDMDSLSRKVDSLDYDVDSIRSDLDDLALKFKRDKNTNTKNPFFNY